MQNEMLQNYWNSTSKFAQNEGMNNKFYKF